MTDDLISAARFEFFLILEYKYIDSEREVMVVSTGEAFHLEELCFYLPIPMMKRWFDFASKIKDLKLSQDEMLIVMAVSLTFRGNFFYNPASLGGIYRNHLNLPLK